MSRGVNRVTLIGNAGQDPEVRYAPSGTPIVNLRIATTDTWTDRPTGQRQERTEWHSLVGFNKTAEITQRFVQKGTRVYVEGRLQTRKWQGQDGQDRYSTEIVINEIQALSNGKQAGDQPQAGSSGQQQQPNNQGNQPPPQQAPVKSDSYGAPVADEFNAPGQEIPF